MLLTDIKGNSLDDGPGIRSVVFFKGCPLSCTWCHNPETQRAAPQLAYDQATCVQDRGCVTACPEAALDPNSADFVDRERCTMCGECLTVCPSGALEIVGHQEDAEAVLAQIDRYIPFYRNSGGGVTISGGEPTHQMASLGKLVKALKARDIHTLLETSGHFRLSRYSDLVEPWLDQVYFDLKLADDAEHRTFCGISNGVILANFRELTRRAQAGGVPVLPRIPLVPGVTATEANLGCLAQLLGENDVSQVALLPYNPTWTDKAAKVGAEVTYERSSIMSKDEIEYCESFFTDFNLVH